VDKGLFVITVASEKGGVGKTTIATNLAVYLKALREDLPVSILSFDNHFSVDNMFAIGSHSGRSVGELFAGGRFADLLQLGEYGVQFMVSQRDLQPPDDDLFHLRRSLRDESVSGVLIIDTRPILDYFTCNALNVADLVLTPVKDRASLVNASALREFLQQDGAEDRIWLVPSLIDGRLRLQGKVGVAEFLRFSGEERGFKVANVFVNKSPKVEGLATGFSSRIHPVLTHARGTSVHRQFRRLAEFILRQHAESDQRRNTGPLAAEEVIRERRHEHRCPACGRGHDGDEGHLFFDVRSRRDGFLHRKCLAPWIEKFAFNLPEEGALLIDLHGAGWLGEDAQLVVKIHDAEGEEVDREAILTTSIRRWEPFLKGLTGRGADEWMHEMVLITLQPGSPDTWLADEGKERLSRLRRHVLRRNRSDLA